MAESTELVAQKRSKIVIVRDFLVDTREEMSKVSWPERPELIKATRAVIIGSVILGIAIGLVDWMLGKILVTGVSALVG